MMSITLSYFGCVGVLGCVCVCVCVCGGGGGGATNDISSNHLHLLLKMNEYIGFCLLLRSSSKNKENTVGLQKI